MRVWYVYIHFKPNGRPFYVGKGLSSRAFSIKRHHSPGHCNIINKYGQASIKVWRKAFESHEEAIHEEKRLIAELRLMGVPIVNRTDGGDGTPGYKRSPEQCAANGARKIGNKNRLGAKHSEETKRMIGLRQKEYWSLPENRIAQSQRLVGRSFGDGFRRKMANIQSNKKWITNGVEDSKIDKGSSPPAGWRFGRAKARNHERGEA